MRIILKYRKSLMQGGFGGKMPEAPALPKPPAPTDAASNVNGNPGPARKGFGSTLLTSGLGVGDQTSKKTVLGG